MPEPVSIQALIGKRCLLKVSGDRGHGWGSSQDVQEYRVLEASPSGNWVRLQTQHGHKFWKAVTNVSLVEELREIQASRSPTFKNDIERLNARLDERDQTVG